MENKHIFAVDLILIVGTLLTLIATIGFTNPLVIAPVQENVEQELFTLNDAKVLFIDTDKNFTSFKKYNLEEEINFILEPGIYYWKTTNNSEVSTIRTITIKSEANLVLKPVNDVVKVFNSGINEFEIEEVDNREFLTKNNVGVKQWKKDYYFSFCYCL